MVTFYPGPSKLYPQVENFLADAFHSGLLSMNHRSKPFMKMMSEGVVLLKDKLRIPSDYEVVFVSSATECWEVVAQSLTDARSIHLHNGAFGSKWEEYANRIHRRSKGYAYGLNEQPRLPEGDYKETDLLCITHTETSNGTSVTNDSMGRLRAFFPGVIAVDATSSMAGVALPWSDADVWYASVQKCFGLPSGLAVMVLSPRALSQASRIGENDHYNSLGFVVANFRNFQTPYTPNILGIYLLKRLFESIDYIDQIDRELEKRAARLYSYLTASGFDLLIEDPTCQSKTVIAVKASQEKIAAVKEFAAGQDIVLGNGYGKWKETTFRIANFPAVDQTDIEKLEKCLADFTNR